MADIFALGFLDYGRVLIVALLVYAIIYGVLKKIDLFKEPAVNSLIALLIAIIVSFSGVVTYSVTYAINWFIIIFFIIFLLMLILLFLGVKFDEITKQVNKNGKTIMIAFLILFSVIFIKSFFALNNTFDTSEPVLNAYEIDTTINTGIDEVTRGGFVFNIAVDQDLLYVVIFLIIIGVFVWILGRK